jgi:hypothetical protein
MASELIIGQKYYCKFHDELVELKEYYSKSELCVVKSISREVTYFIEPKELILEFVASSTNPMILPTPVSLKLWLEKTKKEIENVKN